MILTWIAVGVGLVILVGVFSAKRSGTAMPAGPATMADVERFIRDNQLISAIKCYREIHHVGLAEAKKAVEELRDKMKSEGKL